MSGEKPREIAVEVLGRRSEREYTEDLLERALTAQALSEADRRLCQELVYGTVRWQATLDWLIARRTGNRVQKSVLQNLLRLGLYQVFWTDRIPAHAAVNVMVELAKRRGFGPQAGFVNAVLRGYLREFEDTKALLENLKQTDPALGYSHPDWLVRRWQARWGPARTADLLKWNNVAPKTFARVNTLKIQAEKLLPLWRDEGVEYDFVRHDWLEDNLVFEFKAHPALSRLASFQQGFFYIQDPSTLLAVRALDPKPGEAVLDLCAAPGGKLTHIAQVMNNQGRLVAHDTNSRRLELIKENCARLGVTCVEVISPNNSREELENGAAARALHAGALFDKVLVDAPCSNTGVLRRRIDLRWRLTLAEIEELRKTQLNLVRQAAQLLKPGGILVYSTCSLEPEENRDVINCALSDNPWLKLQSERELLPFVDECDGACVARFERT